jgi:hypothetical protein
LIKGKIDDFLFYYWMLKRKEKKRKEKKTIKITKKIDERSVHLYGVTSE